MAHPLWHGNWAERLRISSGLVLFTYALFHFLNLGIALLSPEWMNVFQHNLQTIVRSSLGSAILYGSLLIHAALAFQMIATRRNLRLPRITLFQIALGIFIPFQLAGHLIFTRYAHTFHGVQDEYGYFLLLIWGSSTIWWQSLLLLVVWVHGCIGLHFWLRLTETWQRLMPWLIGIAVFVPISALAGLLAEGRRMNELAYGDGYLREMQEDYNWPSPQTIQSLVEIYDYARFLIFMLLVLSLSYYGINKMLRSRRSVKITYADGPQVTAERGMTLLEISQANDVPHTALCGGKGRCTTCRVVLEQGASTVSPPSAAEARTLAAIKAPPNVRLACQVRPDTPLTAHRVFRPDRDKPRAHASQGEERQLAILFLDIRGFTKRSAGMLPYDVVFLLNRFFDAIVPEILAQGGTVDKYMGDGLLALFETRDAKSSASAALGAIQKISVALARFNTILQAEGEPPVKIGMGLHLGHVVLGEIGSAHKAPRTIIGDTVNIASRLEAKTKELDVEALISAEVFFAAGIAEISGELEQFRLRGVEAPVAALQLSLAADLRKHLLETSQI
ncbi:adenylate/guanylate cyclase domain-containing protein [Epibacterium ulvae]|uniref:adenylate/guanylate cyclase domain-containing protein n=1 Tax=Epibacterium ulvae TaxID=1156985 RepID=UPI00249171C3|nr:adenylate/guanylate cyclase domain-containing protein [Epibacterium ulvae]